MNKHVNHPGDLVRAQTLIQEVWGGTWDRHV